MKRNTPLLALTAVTTLALAACQDSAPTGVRPSAAPLADKGGNGNGKGNGNGDDNTLVAGPTSSPGGIVPKAVDGNTLGDGSGDCLAYGGAVAVKVDGNYDQTVAGSAFHVSDGTTLSFSRSSPGYAITAVLVKGGSAYDAYDYRTRSDGSRLNDGTRLGVTADGGLTSPLVGSGKNDKRNVPDISHYVVCYVRNIHVEKKLAAVMTSDGHGGMTRDLSWTGGAVVIPQGETRWLQFEIAYEQPANSTGKITEQGAEACASLGSGFGCTRPNDEVFTVTGSGSKLITIDVTNNTCGDGELTNTAMFDVSGIGWVNSSATVNIVGLCIQKTLRTVYTTGMTPVNGWQQNGMVEVPRNETRWLHYEITYTLPVGVRATLQDVIPVACAGAGITCSSAGLNDRGSPLTIDGRGSPQSVWITVDLKNESACGDRSYRNTVSLVRSGGLTTSASSQSITIWPAGPECPHA